MTVSDGSWRKRLVALLVLGAPLLAPELASAERSVRELCAPTARRKPEVSCSDADARGAQARGAGAALGALEKVQAARTRKALDALLSRYRARAARERDPRGYLKAVQAVLRETVTGAGVLDCFYGPADREFFGEGAEGPRILFNSEGLARFGSGREPDHPEKHWRALKLPLNWAPEFFLATALHEMKHGCDARELSDSRNYSQDGVVDEYRAYAAQLALFKELAVIAPRLVCELRFKSDLFGKTLSQGEYHALLEERMEPAVFADFLVTAYADTPYEAPRIFVTDANGKPLLRHGRRVLREDLERRMRTQ